MELETGISTRRGESLDDLRIKLSELSNVIPQESGDYFSLELKKSKLRERIQKIDTIRNKTIYELLIEDGLYDYEKGRFGTVSDAANYAESKMYIGGYKPSEYEEKLLFWKKMYSVDESESSE